MVLPERSRLWLKRLYAIWDKDFEFKNARNRIINLFMENKFADKTVDFATCVDKNGKRYNIEFDNIRGLEDDFYKANS